MRPLTVTTFLTLDGVAQAPGGPQEDPSGGFPYGGWLVPFADEAMGEQMDAWFRPAEDFLLGRTTYEIFAAHWPHVDATGDPVAQALQTKTKHVASRTLTSLEWSTARLLGTDVPAAVRELKVADGGELQVHGSIGLVQTLLAEDLVDELRTIVFPVVLGTGKRLFEGGAAPRTWELVSSTTTSTGAVMTAHRRTGEVATGSFALEDADTTV
ncbi:dihydrofolate reductase family protein [Geodermatophilus sp. SYSU D00698]